MLLPPALFGSWLVCGVICRFGLLDPTPTGCVPVCPPRWCSLAMCVRLRLRAAVRVCFLVRAIACRDLPILCRTATRLVPCCICWVDPDCICGDDIVPCRLMPCA